MFQLVKSWVQISYLQTQNSQKDLCSAIPYSLAIIGSQKKNVPSNEQ